MKVFFEKNIKKLEAFRLKVENLKSKENTKIENLLKKIDFFNWIFQNFSKFFENENFQNYFSFRKKIYFGPFFLCELEFFSTIDCTGFEGLVKSPGCSSAFA